MKEDFNMHVQSKTTMKTRIQIPTIIASGVSISSKIFVAKSLVIKIMKVTAKKKK